MNDLIRPAMYEAYHHILPVEQNGKSPLIRVDIVGPVCETSDTFCRDREFPLLTTGDLVAVLSSGAYGAVMASEYNSRPLVPEVLVNNSKFEIIRSRPSIESILERDKTPSWLN